MNNSNKKSIIIKSLFKIVYLTFNVNKKYSSLLLLINILQGIIPALSLWLSKLIIDKVVAGIGPGKVVFKETIIFVLLLAGTSIISIIALNISSTIQTLLGDLTANKINTLIIEKAISLDLYQYENSSYYDMLTRAQREASYRPLSIINQINDFIRNVFTLSSLIFVLLNIHWLVVTLLIITSIASSIVQQIFAKKGYSLLYSKTPESRKMYYISSILTSINYFKEIKIFDIGQYMFAKYKEIYWEIYRKNKTLLISKNIYLFCFSFLSLIIYIAVYIYLIIKTIHKIISLGDLMLYSGAFSQCQSRLNGIISNISSLYENNLFINNLFEYLNLKQNVIGPKDPKIVNNVNKKGIRINNLYFRYPGTKSYILKNININIKPNEKIAIVGDNGAGKTTLIKLILRLYDPDEGEIYYEDDNIKLFEPNEYRKIFGIVFQDYSQYYLSARENIGIGDITNINELSKIKNAAIKCGADEVINNLPFGYETILGTYFEKSAQISIGEWQKIAIARAIMRNGAILILDEPTASLDAKTENEIFRQFNEICTGKISIIISHRYSTIQLVDKIYVLEKGYIIEEGTHNELIRMNGKYAKMYTMQAEKYVMKTGLS